MTGEFGQLGDGRGSSKESGRLIKPLCPVDCYRVVPEIGRRLAPVRGSACGALKHFSPPFSMRMGCPPNWLLAS
jgi:hypothetical protein